MRSRLILHPVKSSSSPIYQVAHSFLMNSIVYINYSFSPITSVSSTYTMKNLLFEPFLDGHCLDIFLEP